MQPFDILSCTERDKIALSVRETWKHESATLVSTENLATDGYKIISLHHKRKQGYGEMRLTQWNVRLEDLSKAS